MKERDPWFVRLPDGRTFKVKSSAAVRHHIEAGTIPVNSYVRRDADGEWVSLAATHDFANQTVGGTNRSPASLAEVQLPPLPGRESEKEQPRSGVSARLDPLKLQTVGVRGYVDELFAAFDSSVQTSKLIVGCLTGAAYLGGTFLLIYLLAEIKMPVRLSEIVLWAASLAVLAVGFTFIARQTHLELTKMSPASFGETLAGFVPSLIQVLICCGIVGGIGYGIHLILGLLAKELGDSAFVVGLIGAVGFPAMVLVFVVLLLLPLIAPILVVEGGSFLDGFREWRALIREHRIRVLLYQGLAVAMGIVATLPLLLPCLLAQKFFEVPKVLLSLTSAELVFGLAIGPFIAFMAVANVFIYLNLRYEHSSGK